MDQRTPVQEFKSRLAFLRLSAIYGKPKMQNEFFFFVSLGVNTFAGNSIPASAICVEQNQSSFLFHTLAARLVGVAARIQWMMWSSVIGACEAAPKHQKSKFPFRHLTRYWK